MALAKSHAFISYVRENSYIVDRLASDLRAAGIRIWLDRYNIKPGQWWEDAITEAIEDGAFFIACFSKEFQERRETYMHGELRIAINRLRNMPRNRMWFIPVILNDTDIPSHRISSHENLKDINAVLLYKNWNEGITSILRTMMLDEPTHRRIFHLIDLLNYQPEERRYDFWYDCIIDALSTIGEAAVPALSESLRDPEQDVRRHAAIALSKIGPSASAAVPALIEALVDPDRHMQQTAAEALGEIGPSASAAVPALIEALVDPDRHMQQTAAEALCKISGAVGRHIVFLRKLASGFPINSDLFRLLEGDFLERCFKDAARARNYGSPSYRHHFPTTITFSRRPLHDKVFNKIPIDEQLYTFNYTGDVDNKEVVSFITNTYELLYDIVPRNYSEIFDEPGGARSIENNGKPIGQILDQYKNTKYVVVFGRYSDAMRPAEEGSVMDIYEIDQMTADYPHTFSGLC